MRFSRLPIPQLAAAAVLAMGSCAFAAPVTSSGTVGGTVAPINTLTNDTYTSNVAIVAADPVTDQTIVTGRINNNNDAGWSLSVASGNVGRLTRTEDGGAGGAGREILYTSVKFVKTGGALGAGLSDPNGRNRNIVTGDGTAGTVIFNTGTAPGTVGTATSATVDYDFALKISWGADRSLLSGTYTDTITLTLDNDI